VNLTSWYRRYVQFPVLLVAFIGFVLVSLDIYFLWSSKMDAEDELRNQTLYTVVIALQEHNRNTLETALMSLRNGLHATYIAFCDEDEVRIKVGPANLKCNIKSPLEILIRSGVPGYSNYSIEYSVPIFHRYGVVVSSGIFLMLALGLAGFIGVKSLKHLKQKVLSPILYTSSNPVGITEIDEIRNKIQQHFEMKTAVERFKERHQIAKQVAHDIRSPLSALEIAVGHEEWNNPEAKKLAHHALTRIKQIANDLLAKAKSQDLELIDLTSVINELVEEKRATIGKDHFLEFDFSGESTLIRASKSVLSRVVSNLINNSVEAMPEGGSVKLKVKKDEGAVSLSIADKGKGISSEILSKLGQEPVSMGKEGTESGSGIGLFHTFQSVKSWGGKIEIASQETVGTTVTIKLPAS
jgi:signal transduction histidine kinase